MHNETKKIFKTKEEVIRLLKKYPEYRDNDERLVATFWHNELKAKDYYVDDLNAYDFLKIYSQGKLTSADCIVRARAKAQQDDPGLKGKISAIRKDAGEQVTQEINSEDKTYYKR